MTPRSVVQPTTGAREGQAGVVEKVQKDADGKVTVVFVRMDVDNKLVSYAPGELNVLLAH